MEVDILDRMGKKMRYASMLYGDSAASVLESSDGDEDIKDEIIRAAISGRLTDETAQVKHLFSTGNEKVVQVSADISGSLVASTPELPVTPDWNEWAKLKDMSIARMPRRKNRDAELLVGVGQLSLKF
jgi:hypothetical protein